MPKNLSEQNISNGLKLIAKSSAIVLIGIIVSKLALYLYRVIIARVYGIEAYGLFSLALIILNLFIAISTLGLNEGLLRYIPLYRGKKDSNKIRYFTKISIITLIISSSISAIVLFLMSRIISVNLFHNESLTVYLQISSIIIPFYIFSNVYLAIIRAYEKIVWYSFIINILQNVLKVVFIGIFILIGFSDKIIMTSFLLSIVAMFLVSYYLCKHYLSSAFGEYVLTTSNKKRHFLELFSYSLPLMFSGVLSVIYYWTDSVIIGYFNTVADVGLYNAAVPIALLIAIIPDLFIQMFYPFITRESAKGNKKLVREISKQVSKWVILITIPIASLISVFPGAVINTLFGKEFILASFSLRILALSSFISILSGFLITLLLTAGKSKIVLINFIFTSALNIALNIFLVRLYGFNGAAIATAIVWVIFTVLLYIEVKIYIGFIPLRRSIIKILLVSIIPVLALLLIRKTIPMNPITLLVLVVFFFFLYFLVILFSKCLDRHDMEIFQSVKRRIASLVSI